MRKELISILLCLIIAPMAVTLVRAQTPTLTLTLTASTASTITAYNDSSLYDRYSIVTFIGSMNYNAGTNFYPNDGLAGVQIQDPNGNTLVVRTISTGNVIPYNIPADINASYLCNAGGNQITSIPMPTASNQETPSYYVQVINNEGTIQPMLVTVNMFDSNGVPIALSYATLNVGAYSSSFIQTNFLIDSWAHYGTVYAYVNVYSDWPSNGGVPLAMEKTFQFTITGGTPFPGTAPTTYSLNGVDHYYNFTFRLPNQGNCVLGNYTVYSTANYPYAAYSSGTYVGTQGSQTTTFQVAQFGDLNGDGIVNFADLQIFVRDYINYYQNGAYTAAIDFNNDGKINFADLQLFVKYYLQYWSS